MTRDQQDDKPDDGLREVFDGFGNSWNCPHGLNNLCRLNVVRPGKVQCPCDGGVEGLMREIQLTEELHAREIAAIRPETGKRTGKCGAWAEGLIERKYCDLEFGHPGPHSYQRAPAEAASAGDTPRPARPVMSEGNLSGWSVYVTSLERYADQLEQLYGAACLQLQARGDKSVALSATPLTVTNEMVDAVIRRARDGHPPAILDGNAIANVRAMLETALRHAPVRSTTGAFAPTHKHAEGGHYQQLGYGKMKGGVGSEWEPCVFYTNADGAMFATDLLRWNARFVPISTASATQPNDDSAPLSTTTHA